MQSYTSRIVETMHANGVGDSHGMTGNISKEQNDSRPSGRIAVYYKVEARQAINCPMIHYAKLDEQLHSGLFQLVVISVAISRKNPTWRGNPLLLETKKLLNFVQAENADVEKALATTLASACAGLTASILNRSMQALCRYADLVQFPIWGGGEIVLDLRAMVHFPAKLFWAWLAFRCALPSLAVRTLTCQVQSQRPD